MVPQKNDRKADLSAVKKDRAKIIKLNTPEEEPQPLRKEERNLFPPTDEFNSRYMKGRDNDPL